MSVLLSPASPFLLVAALFLLSLLIVLSAAAWFTRRLEALCDRLDLSAGMLSILSALGANIPNYVASIVAIANGQQDVGLGIIIGSNIYNLAIILGISSLAAPGSHGIHLRLKERYDVLIITYYAFAITVTTCLTIWLLSYTTLATPHTQVVTPVALLLVLVLTGFIFGFFVHHIVQRPHPPHTRSLTQREEPEPVSTGVSLTRLITEVLVALVIALGSVIVMVQSGEQLTADVHMPPVLAGLVVLAVATSLPNTVVAVILVRTGRIAACVEEIFSSNSINTSLGIALPLVFWHTFLQDHLLLILDGPFLVLLTLSIIACIRINRINRIIGLLLLLSYVVWVGLHLLLKVKV